MNEKGRWQRAVNLRYLIIFCMVEICFLALLYTAWQYNRNSYLANRSSHLQSVAEAIITRSEAVAHAITHEIIQQPNIINLFEKACTATELQRQAIRRDLHNKLINTYQRLQQKTPLRIQLVLPDGTSLLRMHKPKHWGDQLFPVREVLRLTASEKREITGYESGRNDFGAYRFAFPLFKHDRFIGIAELSLDDKDLVEQLGRQYKHSYWMMLARRDIALPKQSDKDRQQTPQASAVNPNYIEVLPDHQKHGNAKIAALIKKLQNNTTIHKSTSQHLLFSTVLGAIDGTPIVSTFIPINNAKNQHEAYLVVLGQAPVLKQFDRNFYIVMLVGSLLILGLTLLTRHLSINRRVIREERETLKAITDAMGEGLLVQDSEGQLLYQNPKSKELLGYSDDQLTSCIVHDIIHKHGENEQGQCPLLHNTSSGKNYHNFDEFFSTEEGTLLPVEVIATPLIRSGENVGSVTLFRDIRAQKAAELQLLHMNKLYAALSATNHAIVQISHREELFEEICRIAVTLAGFKAAFIGTLSEDGNTLIPVASAGDAIYAGNAITIQHHDHSGCKLAETLPQRKPHICRRRCTLSGVFEQTGVCLGDRSVNIGVYPLACDGSVIGAMVFYSDEEEIFDQKQTDLLEEMALDVSFALDTLHRFEQHRQAQDELQRISNFDALTGLPNRTLLLDRIDQAITSADKNDSTLGLLLIGLDRFKEVNNSYGHAVGDLVLRDIALRLKEIIPSGTTLARPGGDEFLVLVPDVVVTGCVHLAGSLLSAISSQPIHAAEQSLTVTARIGISVWPADSVNGTGLLKNAYTALSRAKQGDEGSYQFFTADMTTRSVERLTLENELRAALQQHQFVVYYQPKIDISDGTLSGCEALVRWQHPDQGLVGPNWFIPVMEEIGLIGQLGNWVLEEACKQTVQWNYAGITKFTTAVNLSIAQLKNQTLTQEIREILQNTGMHPQDLELEITESTAMHDVKRTLSVIEGLKSLGVRIAIDDFGTGYSSLSYLKRLTADTLKIDRSFIKDLPNDKEDSVIAEAILALAKNLGMQVVAEGVETEEQLEFLKARTCQFVQGYYFAKPMPADEFLLFAQSLKNGGNITC